MGGTLWEEPVFSLTYPGTKLQIFGGKGKSVWLRRQLQRPKFTECGVGNVNYNGGVKSFS